jgi:hypothetical protein
VFATKGTRGAAAMKDGPMHIWDDNCGFSDEKKGQRRFRSAKRTRQLREAALLVVEQNK